jgi:hypothetical protein
MDGAFTKQGSYGGVGAVCEGRHDVRCLDFERFMRCAVGIVLSWRWFCKRLDKG